MARDSKGAELSKRKIPKIISILVNQKSLCKNKKDFRE